MPVIVLGQPGQGKTTFVHKLAYDWATAHRSHHESEEPLSSKKARIELPDNPSQTSITKILEQITLLFAFQLRDLKGNERIIDFILPSRMLPGLSANLAKLKDWICENPSEVLVILDGFDEMNGKCDELEQILSGTLPDFPLIITSRPYSLPKECPWNRRFEICNLDAEQARQLIEKYGFAHKERTVKKLVEFCQRRENEFLLSSPLLLHYICVTVLSRMEKSDDETKLETILPRSRARAYIMVAEWLATAKRQRDKHTQSSEASSSQSPKASSIIRSDLANALSTLAFTSTLADQLSFNASEVAFVCGRNFADDAMKLGFLVADVPFVSNSTKKELETGFPHKSFQEFFAALHIVRRFEVGSKMHKLIATAFESNPDVLLFTIGIACEVPKSSAIGELLKFAVQFVQCKVHREKYDDDDDYFRVLGFLNALWRETTGCERKYLQNNLAKEASDVAAFQRFTEFCMSADDNARAFPKIASGLFPFGLSLQAFQALDAFGCHFLLFVRCANDDGVDDFSVCEISDAVAGIPIAQIKESDVRRQFVFNGTVRGLSSFLRSFDVRLSGALVNPPVLSVSKTPLSVPVSTKLRRIDGQKRKTRSVATSSSSMKKSPHLILSWRLDVDEVRSVVEFLSTIVASDKEAKIIDINFFDDETFGLQQGRTAVSDSSADDKPQTTIAVGELILIFASSESSRQCRSPFEALLSCIGSIDRLIIGDNAIPLLDELDNVQSERRLERMLATVDEIVYYDHLHPPNASLAKFIADVKAKKLRMLFSCSSSISATSFDNFSKVLIEEQQQRGPLLLQTISLNGSRVQLFVRAIVGSLAKLLSSLQDLKIIYDGRDDATKEHILSSIPVKLHKRVEFT